MRIVHDKYQIDWICSKAYCKARRKLSSCELINQRVAMSLEMKAKQRQEQNEDA